MAKQRLYIVHGMGPDAVGLVSRIASPIAQANGNIIDLRQDVLHGLFTIYMVVDLSASSLELDAFDEILQEIRDDTGLQITADHFTPVARTPEKKNLLIICVGRDQTGIIAASSKMLGQYNANIEFARTVGREGVFLMELLTDVSHAVIPLENLKKTVRDHMAQLNIWTGFQDEHVFLKGKRLVLFQVVSSFIPDGAMQEILLQTGISQQDLAAAYPAGDIATCLRHFATRLDGIPLDVMNRVLSGVTPTAGSTELIQTLKVMGYKVVLASTACGFLTEHLKKLLDIDHAYGTGLKVDDDDRSIVGELATDRMGGYPLPAVLGHLTTTERVPADDVTIIADDERLEPVGIRIELNLEVLLDCVNKRVLSRDQLLGLLGSFGIPRTV